MTTSIITPQIVVFAQSVRAELRDLPAEERDELTDGLEADLAEAYAEDLERELPDPGEYATELRNAAGLPKEESTAEGLFASLNASMRRSRAELESALRGKPALVAGTEFLGSIRPAWWVGRAVLAAWLVAMFFGTGGQFGIHGLMWVVLAAFVVISVQWGRGRWGFPGLAGVVVVGNLFAILTIPVLYSAGWWGSQSIAVEYSDGGQDLTGVYLDGSQVTNVFPYDAQGKPLDDVQLFTQDGQPLRATVDGSDGCIDPDCTTTGLWVPRVLSNGLTARNVFPMSMAPASTTATDGLQPDPDAVVEPRPLPFRTAPTVLAPDPEQTPEKVAGDNE